MLNRPFNATGTNIVTERNCESCPMCIQGQEVVFNQEHERKICDYYNSTLSPSININRNQVKNSFCLNDIFSNNNSMGMSINPNKSSVSGGTLFTFNEASAPFINSNEFYPNLCCINDGKQSHKQTRIDPLTEQLINLQKSIYKLECRHDGGVKFHSDSSVQTTDPNTAIVDCRNFGGIAAFNHFNEQNQNDCIDNTSLEYIKLINRKKLILNTTTDPQCIKTSLIEEIENDLKRKLNEEIDKSNVKCDKSTQDDKKTEQTSKETQCSTEENNSDETNSINDEINALLNCDCETFDECNSNK